MFGVDWQEFLIIGIVALVVIGPKDLPRAMRVVGQWVGKARATARHFRSGIDTMIREAELEEMNTRWAEQNKAIMGGTPMPDLSFADPAIAAPDDVPVAPPATKPRARRKRATAAAPGADL
jgi:sec-independent protein translocase protein TatB